MTFLKKSTTISPLAVALELVAISVLSKSFADRPTPDHPAGHTSHPQSFRCRLYRLMSSRRPAIGCPAAGHVAGNPTACPSATSCPAGGRSAGGHLAGGNPASGRPASSRVDGRPAAGRPVAGRPTARCPGARTPDATRPTTGCPPVTHRQQSSTRVPHPSPDPRRCYASGMTGDWQTLFVWLRNDT